MIKKSKKKKAPQIGQGRQSMLGAAVRLFAHHGFEGTSVRDLAAEAGVSTALVRKYFGSKQGLHDAADQYALERIREYTEQVFSSADSIPLLEVTKRAVDFASREADVLAYLRYALTSPSGHGEAIFEKYLELFTDQVRSLKARDLLADDVDEFWLPFILMFLQMGPLIVEPYFVKRHGHSLYERRWISGRNAAYRQLLTSAVIKTGA